MRAKYVGIKRFAVHDGPGIRTTLFLKGCSLACKWCHNPESISGKTELGIHFEKCALCGACANFCPLHKIENGKHIFDFDQCKACGKCEEVCVKHAIELFGKEISVDEAFEKLIEDNIFYEDGGGVTLSGGEALLQSHFCAELCKRLKAENIHCAIDTCAYVPWENIERVLPYSDLFLVDFKVCDAEKHRAYTGHSNELIIENLRKLDEQNIPIEIRMIMVPNLNMSEEDIHGAAKILSQLKNVEAVRLLAFHSLAHSKYESVNRPDTIPNQPSPTKDELESVAKILRQYSINVKGII